MPKLIDNSNLILHLEPEDVIVREGLDRYRKDMKKLVELKDSIATYGQIQPILITDDYELVAGGRRLAACAILGVRVKAIFKKDVSDVELRELELEENLQRENLSPAEEVQAIAEIHRLKQLSHGVSSPGKKDQGWPLKKTAAMTNQSIANVAEAIELAKLIEQFPLLANAKTKKEIKKVAKITTDLMLRMTNLSSYEADIAESDESITLEHADAKKHMTTIPDESIDLLLTDPPFGIDINKTAIHIGGDTGGDNTTAGYKFDDSKEIALDVLSVLAVESYRFCKPNAHAYVFVAPEFFGIVRELFMAVGWLVRIKPIVWIKHASGQNNAPHAWPSSAYEFILFARKAESRLLQEGKPDWIQCHPVVESTRLHPTEKPVGLLEDLIARTTNFNQTLYDPFCGSGSALEAGINMKLKVIGCEILDEAYATASMRIANTLAKQKDTIKQATAMFGKMAEGEVEVVD